MIKITFCLRRRPEFTSQQFHEYWYDHHAPLVRKHSRALRMKRYVQTHASDTPINGVLRDSRGGPEPFDGVAEVWWESVEDMMAPLDDPAGQAASRALLEDEQKFIDLANSPLWLNEERVIFG